MADGASQTQETDQAFAQALDSARAIKVKYVDPRLAWYKRTPSFQESFIDSSAYRPSF